MTSSRAYRAALPTEIAVEEIKLCSGAQFDPEIVDLFIDEELYLL
jgi:putative two-component system response regulator